MKPLDKLADELEELTNKYHARLEKVTYMLTPNVCPRCKKLKIDHADLISLYHSGECLSCDASYGEALEEKLKDTEYE